MPFFSDVNDRAKRRAIIMMTIGALLTGALLSFLLKSFAAGNTQVPTQAARVALELEEETLGQENRTLESELLKLQSDSNKANQAEEALADARNKAALTAVTGPGVIVTLDDSNQLPSADAQNVNLYIIHEEYLREVVNALWNGGAEAIVINDQRVSTHTGIVCSGSVILINNTPQSRPYTIKAIGNPKALEASLDFYYWQYLLAFQEQYGITCTVKESQSLEIPASKPVGYRYAEPVGEG